MSDLQSKLHPNRFPNASGKMKAMIAFLIGIEVDHPDAIKEMAVTSEGCLMARHQNDVGMEMVGTFEGLDRNWRLLIQTAGLTPDEAHDAEELLKDKITFFGLSDPRIEAEGVQA